MTGPAGGIVWFNNMGCKPAYYIPLTLQVGLFCQGSWSLPGAACGLPCYFWSAYAPIGACVYHGPFGERILPEERTYQKLPALNEVRTETLLLPPRTRKKFSYGPLSSLNTDELVLALGQPNLRA